jgi:hypothetical protein
MSGSAEQEIMPEVVQAARRNPNGWVYKIERSRALMGRQGIIQRLFRVLRKFPCLR